MKILENLWQVGGAEYTTVEDAAIYLVRFDKKAILIDAGCGNAQENLFENISEILPPEISDHQQRWRYEDGPWKGPELPLLGAADSIHKPPASTRFAPFKHALAVTVEPFKFSPA